MNFINLIRLGLLAFIATLAFRLPAQPIAQEKLQQTEDSLRAIVYYHQLPDMAVAIVSRDSVLWQQLFPESPFSYFFWKTFAPVNTSGRSDPSRSLPPLLCWPS